MLTSPASNADVPCRNLDSSRHI